MPATHATDLKKTYAQVATGYDQKHQQPEDIESLQKFVEHIPAGGQILDLGTGTGTEARWLVDQGFEVTLFDLSEEMLAIAQRKIPDATAIQGDMTEMAFEAESFDGVFSRASILHLTKDEAKKVVKKVFEILKPRGTFFVSLKLGEGEKKVEDDKYGVKVNRFFAFYTQKEAEELVQSAGFTSVHSVTKQFGQAWVQVMGRKK
jgi:ubiquinone/menaquinone biosynthesis C-methylase UbiE